MQQSVARRHDLTSPLLPPARSSLRKFAVRPQGEVVRRMRAGACVEVSGRQSGQLGRIRIDSGEASKHMISVKAIEIDRFSWKIKGKNNGFSRFPKLSWEIWMSISPTPQVTCRPTEVHGLTSAAGQALNGRTARALGAAPGGRWAVRPELSP